MSPTATVKCDLLRDIHDLTDREIAETMHRWEQLSELVVPRRTDEADGPELPEPED